MKNKFQGNEIISVHIGQTGCNIGVEFWAKMCIEEGLSKYENPPSIKSGDRMSGAFFGEDGRGSLHPIAIFIDITSKCFSLPCSKHFTPLLDKSNIKLLENENLLNHFRSNIINNDKFLLMEIEDALINQLERCNSFQGFFITYSAGEPASTNIGLKLHEMISDTFEKELRFDFQIYNSRIPGSIEKINFESNSAVWGHQFSDLVFPFQVNSILEKISGNDYNSMSNSNSVNKIIADVISMITYPLRRNL